MTTANPDERATVDSVLKDVYVDEIRELPEKKAVGIEEATVTPAEAEVDRDLWEIVKQFICKFVSLHLLPRNFTSSRGFRVWRQYGKRFAALAEHSTSCQRRCLLHSRSSLVNFRLGILKSIAQRPHTFDTNGSDAASERVQTCTPSRPFRNKCVGSAPSSMGSIS
jgi:hypothetical protein